MSANEDKVSVVRLTLTRMIGSDEAARKPIEEAI